MEERINVAEILKDCPFGMELNCLMYDDVYFDYVDEFDMIHCYIQWETCKTSLTFNQYGTPNSVIKSKCVIFPKGKTTWEGFQGYFKDGDIVASTDGTWIGITTGGENHEFIPTYCVIKDDGEFEAYFDTKEEWCFGRLATEEEKEKLFKVIKDNGYEWDTETKRLEKLVVPKFKVGDEIVQRNSISNSWIVSSVNSEYYGLRLDNGFDGIGVLPVSEQDDWELITNKLERSVEPKFKIGDRVKEKKSYISGIITDIDDDSYKVEYKNGGMSFFSIKFQNDLELVPNKFDINTLKPFESRVLVRTANRKWVTAFYSHYDKDSSLHYCAVGGLWYEQCIPYEGNEHLLNTTDDCNEFYKNW